MSGRGKIFKHNPNKPAEEAGQWDDILDGRPSKTAQKKSAERMKALGEQLATLPIKQIQKLPLSETTMDALMELSNISAFEARRRHVQLLGKLMRHENETEITNALAHHQGVRKNAQVVRWIARLTEHGDIAINEFVRQFPAAERHTLRQHVLKVQRSKALNETVEQQTMLTQALQQYVQQASVLSE